MLVQHPASALLSEPLENPWTEHLFKDYLPMAKLGAVFASASPK